MWSKLVGKTQKKDFLKRAENDSFFMKLWGCATVTVVVRVLLRSAYSTIYKFSSKNNLRSYRFSFSFPLSIITPRTFLLPAV